MSYLIEQELAEQRRAYGLRMFVETGCDHGLAIECALKAGFESVFSCDIRQEAVRTCQQRFREEPVSVHRSDSVEFLANLLPELEGPTFFWLDAHFPGFYGQRELETERTRFPLSCELHLISKLKTRVDQDVIACDDIRVIRDPANPRFRNEEVNEYFAVTDLTLKQLWAPFAGTHSVEIDCREEGIAYLKPRAFNVGREQVL